MKNIIISLALAGFMFAGCYAPTAKRLKEPARVVKPEYHLAGTNEWDLSREVTYGGGSLTLWALTAQPQQFKRLLQATEDYNKATSEKYKFHRNTVLPLLKKRNEHKQALAVLENERQNILSSWTQNNLEALLATRQSRLEKAQIWFEQVMASNGFNEDNKAHAKTLFDKYCDAKIWEMTTDLNFLNASYRMRPTPLAMCEKSYSDRSLFVNVEAPDACSDAENPAQGKNYFKCLWLAAAKTSFVSQMDESGTAVSSEGVYSAAQGKALAALVNNQEGKLKEKLADQKYVNNILRGLSNIKPTMTPVEFYEPLLTKAELKDKKFELFTVDRMLTAVEDFEFFKSFSVRPLLIANENERKALEERVTFVPDVPGNNPQAIAAGRLLSEQIILLAKKRFENKKNANEVIFNHILLADQSAVSNPADFNLNGITFIDLTQQNSTTSIDAAITDAQLTLAKTDEAYQNALAEEEKFDPASQAAFSRKVAAVNDTSPIVADVLFGQISLTTQPVGENLMFKVKLHTAARLEGIGCVSTVTGHQVQCDDTDMNVDGARVIPVSLDIKSQQVNLDLPLLEDATRWGFVDGVENESLFNRITMSELANKTLHIEVLPNTMYNIIPFIFGKASLRHANGTELRMGSVAYLMDASLDAKTE